jgi:hypothetical protein
MKTAADAPQQDVADAGITASGIASTGLVGAWTRFWFQPIAPLGLHWMRFLSGVLFLVWLLPVYRERHALFGLDGWVDAAAYREISRLPLETVPVPIGWSLTFGFGTSHGMLEVFWWGSIAILVLFTLGIATRITAVLTWLIVVSCMANPAANPDTDYILVLPAFYLMIGYLFLGQWSRPTSLVERILGPRGTSVFAGLRREGDEPAPSHAANFALRLLQVHFAVVVVTSGLHKLQFGEWWSGGAYWYPMHPPLAMDVAKLNAERASGNFTLFVLSLAAYAALAWQISFPVFAFRRRWRWLLLSGGAIGWLGATFVYGEPTFGPLYAVCCLSYLTTPEWQRLTSFVSWPFERRTLAGAELPVRGPKPRLKASTAIRE